MTNGLKIVKILFQFDNVTQTQQNNNKNTMNKGVIIIMKINQEISCKHHSLDQDKLTSEPHHNQNLSLFFSSVSQQKVAC